MADLVVIVPSRGRPKTARELADAFTATCTAATELVFAVDDDDPALPAYVDVSEQAAFGTAVCVVPSPRSMVHALNVAAEFITLPPDGGPFAIGFMGDDHRPRTKGWDSAYLGALRDLGTGIVYGNDLLQGERLPTQCAMTADIIRALGYMAPATLQHMYVDNFWLELGRAAGCIRYLPTVVVEHLHPVAGKADWDDGYKRVNAPTVYAQDEAAFRDYLRDRMGSTVEKVQALRSVDA